MSSGDRRQNRQKENHLLMIVAGRSNKQKVTLMGQVPWKETLRKLLPARNLLVALLKLILVREWWKLDGYKGNPNHAAGALNTLDPAESFGAGRIFQNKVPTKGRLENLCISLQVSRAEYIPETFNFSAEDGYWELTQLCSNQLTVSRAKTILFSTKRGARLSWGPLDENSNIWKRGELDIHPLDYSDMLLLIQARSTKT